MRSYRDFYLALRRRVSSIQHRLVDPSFPKSCLSARIGANQYGAYCVPVSALDRPAGRRIFKGEVYEAATIAYIRDLVGDGDVVHAGTYFGDFIPALSCALVPGARLWAFEPNYESFECASITVLLNRLHNVRLQHCALGEKQGLAFLQTRVASGNPFGGRSRLGGRVDDPSSGESVAVVSLDDVIPADRHVSVLQLDLEGFEEFALRGAMTLVKRCRPLIILEEMKEVAFAETGWVRATLANLGYENPKPVDGNLVFHP